jgi:hypothetical protein
MCQDKVIKERRVLLPHLVFLVYKLFIFLVRSLIYEFNRSVQDLIVVKLTLGVPISMLIVVGKSDSSAAGTCLS